ncbi:RdgB/HAM1 family non-canonical purine NTP pyrophosphatase [Kaistia geumhonensis]|uniref:dITP/XTP pyrophosphatase n=1 Tax=Kaistia geumhonensis TaxID=410839 RepID=A0ABU0M7P6_9HYPH|nr:RdgB/HAM1 family non-canonical purine NTP pyrophosphatase [Kaistia geumhonensis]MCX5477800.1 RdgB/HAM1 family non-canonical purine NTP pyrophosphatase [Kaistia geumhonensis]MDQ0516989.1 XTP/dITP diphosphohydrolase [Kaistia geumhonensis]
MSGPRLSPGDTLVVATHNKGKLREFADLLKPFGLKTVSAGELGLPEPPETGTTFEENATIKAVAAATASGYPALSDDSGLCVDALDGEPGVYSADWAGSDKDFSRAMRNVEEKLQLAKAVSPEARTGRFVAVLCLAFPGGERRYYRGEVEGTLVWPPRGTIGFGYDPMFLPEGHERTFGEMSADEKHGWSAGRTDALSHRARAFALFAAAELQD